jgi:hypothetical protein
VPSEKARRRMLPVMVSTKIRPSPRKLAASSIPQMTVMAYTPTSNGGRRIDRMPAIGLDMPARLDGRGPMPCPGSTLSFVMSHA